MENHASSSRFGQMLNKVPEVTLYFWIIKIMCTTIGGDGRGLFEYDLQSWFDAYHVHHGCAAASDSFFSVQGEKVYSIDLLACCGAY